MVMSLGIYPEFELDLIGISFESTGEALARNYDVLDRIADKAGIERFTAFSDNRNVPSNFDGSPEELNELLGPWFEWFDARQGRRTMESLLTLIRTNSIQKDRIDSISAVVSDLEELVRVLTVAEDEGVRFRLQMS
jgi:hypothetical protein